MHMFSSVSTSVSGRWGLDGGSLYSHFKLYFVDISVVLQDKNLILTHDTLYIDGHLTTISKDNMNFLILYEFLKDLILFAVINIPSLIFIYPKCQLRIKYITFQFCSIHPVLP